MSLGSSNESNDSIREDRHPTGITILDEEVLRGLPKGSTIAIIGAPDSASEMLLHSLAATGRKTQYVTSLRSENGLLDDIIAVSNDDVEEEAIRDNVTIRDPTSGADGWEEAIRRSQGTVDDGNLIIDTMSYYYDKDELMQMARHIYTKTKRQGGLTYLYFSATDIEQLTREECEILHMVDGVFNVRTNIIGGSTIENNMFINKLRGMDYPKEAQELVFGSDISVDTTGGIG